MAVRRSAATLRAEKAAKVDDVLFPPGDYPAERRQMGIALPRGQIKWTTPEFRITLTAEQLRSMGAKNTDKMLSVEYDVTKYVRSGEFVVV
jgi:hypothetical protein